MSGAGSSNPSGSGSTSAPCKQCGDTSHQKPFCPQLPCLHCKGTGHSETDCTTPPGRLCFICCLVGHYSMDCPKPVPGPRCDNCGGYGHGTASNPKCATVQQIPLCVPCNKHHRPRECPRTNRPKQYSEWDGTPGVCTKCGQPGHVFRNCLKKT